MQNADVILIHSFLIILSQRAFIRRTLGHSLVRIRMLDSGIKLDCTLAHCLKWAMQQRPGWVHLPSEEQQDPGATPGLQLTAAHR